MCEAIIYRNGKEWLKEITFMHLKNGIATIKDIDGNIHEAAVDELKIDFLHHRIDLRYCSR